MSECIAPRLADQQMNVFGHGHTAEHTESKTASDALERRLKGLLRLVRAEAMLS
jgi:hypothetical protein